MGRRLALLILASLAVLGGLVAIFVSANKSSLVRLEGSILKVRTYALSKQATLVLADFRLTNPTRVPFVVNSIEMFLDRPGYEPAPAGILTRGEVERVFAYQKFTGPQYNETLRVGTKIAPGETMDRMSAGRVELTEADLERRTAVRLRIRELDGRVSEITEASRQKQ